MRSLHVPALLLHLRLEIFALSLHLRLEILALPPHLRLEILALPPHLRLQVLELLIHLRLQVQAVRRLQVLALLIHLRPHLLIKPRLLAFLLLFQQLAHFFVEEQRQSLSGGIPRRGGSSARRLSTDRLLTSFSALRSAVRHVDGPAKRARRRLTTLGMGLRVRVRAVDANGRRAPALVPQALLVERDDRVVADIALFHRQVAPLLAILAQGRAAVLLFAARALGGHPDVGRGVLVHQERPAVDHLALERVSRARGDRGIEAVVAAKNVPVPSQ